MNNTAKRIMAMSAEHMDLKKEMPKVAICVPSGDMVHKGFAMSLAAMAYTSAKTNAHPAIPIAIIGTEGSLIVRNRNTAVDEAIKQGVDYVLFLDSDLQFPPGTLRMLLAHERDIVGATYIQREEPHRLLGKWKPDTLLTTDSLNEVDALPGGCILINVKVFKDMVKPYFRTPAFEANGVDPEWIQGEDYYFCEQAKKLGFKIWLDAELSVALGHIGRKVNVVPIMAPQVQEVVDGQTAAVH